MPFISTLCRLFRFQWLYYIDLLFGRRNGINRHRSRIAGFGPFFLRRDQRGLLER